MPGICSFNEIWLSKPEYSKWLRKVVEDKRKAYCCVCKKSLHLSAMGEAALQKHAQGKKNLPEKQLAEMEKRALKRKASEKLLDELKIKHAKLLKNIAHLEETADQKAFDAEELNRKTLLTESNALRKNVKQKKEELKGLEKEMEDLKSSEGASSSSKQ